MMLRDFAVVDEGAYCLLMLLNNLPYKGDIGLYAVIRISWVALMMQRLGIQSGIFTIRRKTDLPKGNVSFEMIKDLYRPSPNKEVLH